ncbi:MAG: hypothetical protein DHS20C16_14920 [Phycisphaerae bacterium]|nr:MAG: hypothetical protein DHS20C16_14920 [Phycisphaerae bacterium]
MITSRNQHQGEPILIRQRRRPTWVAVIFAAAVFLLIWMTVFSVVVGMVAAIVYLRTPEANDDDWLPATFLLAAISSVPIAAYASRKAFFHSKWQTIRAYPSECHVCGYNLTGNISGVYSECGTAVPKAAESAGRDRV